MLSTLNIRVVRNHLGKPKLHTVVKDMGFEAGNEAAIAKRPDDDSVSSEESSEDELALDGEMVRNPAVSSSSEDDERDEVDAAADKKVAANPSVNAGSKRKANDNANKKAKNKKKSKKASEPETIEIEFTFCDMDEKYFHGLKSLLHNSSTVYQNHSSTLADLMIENVSVGTVVSTTDADREEGNIFGFGSVLNVTTYQKSPAVQFLKEFCLKHCPADRKKEFEVVLSGKTKRPAGFLLHGRMVNLPLDITLVLHQQLVLDMDWAVDSAEGGESERKSLNFGAFVRLAPCQQEKGAVVYKFFDDEIFAGRAEFVYTVDAPKSYSSEDKQLVSIMVLTKTGHRAAMNDMSKLIQR